jgi:hypothetical protein
MKSLYCHLRLGLTTISLFLLLSIVLGPRPVSSTGECGTEDRTFPQELAAARKEISMFGSPVNWMSETHFSRIFQSLGGGGGIGAELSFQDRGPAYQLERVPIVFHVLSSQAAGGSGSPSMTDLQRDHLLQITNEAFNIYDRRSKTSVQFVGGTVSTWS